MDVLNVKVPEDQKKTLERLVVEKQYPSVSEYVREALRDKMERELELSNEVKDRIDTIRERREQGEDRTIPHEQVKDELGL